ETGNEWLPDVAANAVIIRAMIDELTRAGHTVGIYSTPYQWQKIAGDYAPGVPTWVPGAPPEDPASFCTGHSFGGGPTWMAQSGDPDFDTDRLCPAGLAAYKVAFAPPAPLEVPTYADRSSSPAAAPRKAAPAPVAPLALGASQPAPPRPSLAAAVVHRPGGGRAALPVWLVVVIGLLFEVGFVRRIGRPAADTARVGRTGPP
ncbi:MAG: glycoside hydrolase family 25 domain-containing protein, partial [Acidimicrobiales bacterium]